MLPLSPLVDIVSIELTGKISRHGPEDILLAHGRLSGGISRRGGAN
jgi:hypothetical protein